MIISTPGIVLHTTPYGETSLIAKVLTRELGLRSYIVKGVRTQAARTKQGLFQPMTELDMVVYNNTKTDLNYTKELSPRHPETFTQSSNQAIRHSLLFFMAEVLYRSLHEAEPLPALYDYVAETLATLQPPLATLPIRFMLGVACHLGIEPLDNYSVAEPLFSLDDGRYVSVQREPMNTLDPEQSQMLHQILTDNYLQPTANGQLSTRTALLNSLIEYYRIHLATFGEFKSHEILHTVLA